MYWPFEAATSATIEKPKLSSPSSASKYRPGDSGSPPAPPTLSEPAVPPEPAAAAAPAAPTPPVAGCTIGSQSPTEVTVASQPAIAHAVTASSAAGDVRVRAIFQPEPDTLRCWRTMRALASASTDAAAARGCNILAVA